MVDRTHSKSGIWNLERPQAPQPSFKLLLTIAAPPVFYDERENLQTHLPQTGRPSIREGPAELDEDLPCERERLRPRLSRERDVYMKDLEERRERRWRPSVETTVRSGGRVAS